MSKLTEKQKREMLKDFLQNRLNRFEIMQKYNIKERQYEYYNKKFGFANPKGRPPIEKNIFGVDENMKEQEIIKEPETQTEPVKVETSTDDKPQEPQLTKSELLGQKPQEPEPLKLDPNKNYCANCFRNNKLTEVTKEMNICPICGSVLDWD